ncbi:MAG TPA: 50S ribosomal protein L32 [Candidatus Paceibacterota bacterium]|nr:50S ribosomal protein L32 [Candidatus Paceibacterota bacterium]
MRRNRSQTAQRRSHHAIAAERLVKCEECGALRQSHRACAACGKYNGKVVIDIVARQNRAARRTKRHEKELRESGHDTKQKETAGT